MSLHYNVDNSYLLVNGKKSWSLNPVIKRLTLPTQFCLGSISNGFCATESREVSWNGNGNGFSVDCHYIDKCDILNIHKHLMTKNDIK